MANFDLVAIFRKTIFLYSKNSRFSGHFVKLLTFDLVASKLELASLFELLNQRISVHFRMRQLFKFLKISAPDYISFGLTKSAFLR